VIAAAADIVDEILEKILLMLPDTVGIMAPAEIAMNPATRAYSMRS
jgi:hypothetical protein